MPRNKHTCSLVQARGGPARERFGVAAAAAATPDNSLARAPTRHHANRRGLLYLRQEAQRPPSDRPCMRFDKDAVSDGLERPNLITSLEESRTTLEE